MRCRSGVAKEFVEKKESLGLLRSCRVNLILRMILGRSTCNKNIFNERFKIVDNPIGVVSN